MNTKTVTDWLTEAAKSPAWGEFLRWAGDEDKPHYPVNLTRTRWDAFHAGVIVGQKLAAEGVLRNDD